jgi:hypothetical protein
VLFEKSSVRCCCIIAGWGHHLHSLDDVARMGFAY